MIYYVITALLILAIAFVLYLKHKANYSVAQYWKDRDAIAEIRQNADTTRSTLHDAIRLVCKFERPQEKQAADKRYPQLSDDEMIGSWCEFLSVLEKRISGKELVSVALEHNARGIMTLTLSGTSLGTHIVMGRKHALSYVPQHMLDELEWES